MFTHIILAENEYYRIEKRTFRPFPTSPNFAEEYLLMDWSDETVYVLDTLEDLNKYLTENNITIAPKIGFVSNTTLNICRQRFKEFNRQTNQSVTISIDTDHDEALSVSVNWSCLGDVDAKTTRQYAEWLTAAAELADCFPYTGLKIDYDN